MIGLVTVLVTIVGAAFGLPPVITEVTRVIDAGSPDYLALIQRIGGLFAWAAVPFIGGLLLMASGRVIMLLSAINRSLRGQS